MANIGHEGQPLEWGSWADGSARTQRFHESAIDQDDLARNEREAAALQQMVEEEVIARMNLREGNLDPQEINALPYEIANKVVSRDDFGSLEMSRRTVLEVIIALIVGLLFSRFGVEVAKAQQEAELYRAFKAPISTEFAQTLGNSDLLHLMEAAPTQFRGTDVQITVDQLTQLGTLPNYGSSSLIAALNRFYSTPDYDGKMQIGCTVFCDQNHQFFISSPTFRTTQEIQFDTNRRAFAVGTLVSFDNQGTSKYIEPNQVISPSQASLLVINPDVRSTLAGRYTDGSLTLSFDSMQDGDLLLAESIVNGEGETQLLQVALEQAGNFPLLEVRLTGSGNIRSERSTSSIALRHVGENGSIDVYVTPLQMSLDAAITQFNAPDLQRDEQGRFYTIDGSHRWYLVQLRDSEGNVEGDYGWIRNDAAGDPELAYTVTPMPETAIDPTPTAAAPTEVAQRGEPAVSPIERESRTYSLRASILGIVALPTSMGSIAEGEVFAICSYFGRSGEQQIAVPLAINADGRSYLVATGFGWNSIQFDAPTLLTISRNNAQYRTGLDVSISFTDMAIPPQNHGVSDIVGLGDIVGGLYSTNGTNSFDQFRSTERADDLPNVGIVNIPLNNPDYPVGGSFRILLPISIVHS